MVKLGEAIAAKLKLQARNAGSEWTEFEAVDAKTNKPVNPKVGAALFNTAGVKGVEQITDTSFVVRNAAVDEARARHFQAEHRLLVERLKRRLQEYYPEDRITVYTENTSIRVARLTDSVGASLTGDQAKDYEQWLYANKGMPHEWRAAIKGRP